MSNINTVPPTELPSSGQLIRSTLIALVVAAALLVVAILPAEYGLDVTGLGRVLGLTQMGEIKVALAKESQEPDLPPSPLMQPPALISNPPASAATTPTTKPATAPASKKSNEPPRADVTTMTFAPGDGKEIKLVMRKNAEVSFEWSVDRGQVNYDTHGDSENPKIKYHGYGKGRGATSNKGVLTAAFDGSHGWFWRNRTKETITITLKTDGDYWEIKRFE